MGLYYIDGQTGIVLSQSEVNYRREERLFNLSSQTQRQQVSEIQKPDKIDDGENAIIKKKK